MGNPVFGTEKKENIIKNWHYEAKAKADITAIIGEALKVAKAERERRNDYIE